MLTAEKLAPKSVALMVESARAFASWATRRGLLPSNPLSGISRIDTKPKVPHRALTDSEIAALMEKAPAHRQVWYATALETGFRVSELRALRVGCLDVDAPCLSLDARHTKDRKAARQFISIELCRQLLALAAGRPADAPLLGIPQRKASTYFREDCDAAEIAKKTTEGKATWHSLRKSFVTAVVQSGADLKTSMMLARHSTASLTMEVYAAGDTGLVRAAADAAQTRLRTAAKAGRGTHVVHRWCIVCGRSRRRRERSRRSTCGPVRTPGRRHCNARTAADRRRSATPATIPRKAPARPVATRATPE